MILDDSHLIVKCCLSMLSKRSEGKLFNELLDQVKFYARFEISDETGDPLDEKQMMALHYDKITSLQKAVFKKFPEMRKFALATVASIDDRENILPNADSFISLNIRGIPSRATRVTREGKSQEHDLQRVSLALTVSTRRSV